MQVGIGTLVLLLLIVALWPPKYRSSATILIESQEIPQDFVRSTITSYAAEQLEVIRQRSMTMQNIMEIIGKFGLYADRVPKLLRSEQVEAFREDVQLDLMSAEVMDPRSGMPMEATIAFTLSFDHETPVVAQKVVNEVVNLYLNENIKQRSARTESTAGFLKTEAETINNELQSLEARIAAFKQQYAQNLPELYQFNLATIERSEREIDEIDMRVRALERDKIEFQSKLRELSPYAPKLGSDGRPVLGDNDRLAAAEAEFRSKSALYSADHPDLQRLKREISSMRSALGVGGDSNKLEEQLRIERDRLSALESKYTKDHPEIAKQKRVINQLQTQWAAASKGGKRAGGANADNPAYLMMEAQARAAESEISTLQAKRAELSEKLARFEMLMAEAPSVEQSYKQLIREHEVAAAKYQDIKAKLREAEISKSLETERKGERFTLIEPPMLPDDPVSPNRSALMLVAIVLSVMLGAAVVVVRESLDQTVRGVSVVSDLVGATPMALLPYMASEDETLKESSSTKKAVLVLAVIFVVVLLLFHFFVKPLDVTWFIMLRRLGIE